MYTVLLAGTEIDTERINWSKQKGKYEKKNYLREFYYFHWENLGKKVL